MKVPYLLPEESSPRLDVLLGSIPQPFVLADFSPKGVESWNIQNWGWRYPLRQVFNVDHHAQNSFFYRKVSSGNLAKIFIRDFGTMENVGINHTDLDSVASAAILLGLLSPTEDIMEAVVSADHTGIENQMADVLQEGQNQRDFLKSLKWLRECQDGKLSKEAVQLRDETRRKRDLVLKLKSRNSFTDFGRVVVVQSDEYVPGSFLPAAFPDAHLIISGVTGSGGRWNNRYRLGNAAPDGKTLFDVFSRIDGASFGGRWNAGSSKRSGGATLSPVEVGEKAEPLISGW